MQNHDLYKIAVNTPFNDSILTYRSGDKKELRKGELVKVPLGKRECLGCVIKKEESNSSNLDIEKIKSIAGPSTYQFDLSPRHFKFFEWISQYYHYPLGMLVADVLPKPLKRPRALKYTAGKGLPLSFELNEDQTEVYQKIQSHLNQFERFLVHGVTGSGKSAIYLKLTQDVLKSGKSVLFLLPEINLTPQFIETFAEHVDVPVYVYNSSVSNSDKVGLWNKFSNENEASLVIGVRSSIFLPIENLGLIVVDEEHDSSFKQEDRCPYNARDISIKKAQLQNCPVVLGSATPSLESYTQFKKIDRYLTLKKRAISKQLPEIKMIDTRNLYGQKFRGEDCWPFHPDALNAMETALNKGEQVLVFLNKLGYADFLQCKMCAHQFSCPNCSANLKYYKKRGEISCQICAYRDTPPEMCPSCQSLSIIQKGFGTEKLTEILREKFTQYRIERFDRDEITTFNDLKDKLDRFHNGEIDVFVGTQMLSKGHNFKKVNLVLVMGIDAQLNFPDYRATERAYQLLTQVSGRPGRFGEDSEVLVHTLNTDNPMFGLVKNHSFDGFYQEEISMREICECPPFSKLAMIYLTGKTRQLASDEAMKYSQFLNEITSKHFKNVEILGPRPSIVEKRVNKFTWAIMLRSQEVNDLHNVIRTLKTNLKPNSGISQKLDIDPYHLY